jgi:2'-5' RNA ligase
MEGIVSLLDEEHYRLTEGLWAELEHTFGLRGIYATPYPHFSYHVAKRYDVEGLEAALKEMAETTRPFQVRTAGLGLFTGQSPVLFIPVVRGQALSQFHQRVWEAVSPLASGEEAHYHPERWMPHITIVFGELPSEKLPGVIRLLSERAFDWQITVDNLTYIEALGQGQKSRFRFKLSG